MDSGSRAGDELLAAVAASLRDRLAEITQVVTEHLAAAIEELRGDSAMLGVLRASVTENITAILHIFEHGMPVDNIEAPPAAIEYARRLAQRGVPAGALIRAYRVGTSGSCNGVSMSWPGKAGKYRLSWPRSAAWLS